MTRLSLLGSTTRTMRACVPHAAAHKPQVEREDREQKETPPNPVDAQGHDDEEDPQREHGAHSDHLLEMAPFPGTNRANRWRTRGRHTVSVRDRSARVCALRDIQAVTA